MTALNEEHTETEEVNEKLLAIGQLIRKAMLMDGLEEKLEAMTEVSFKVTSMVRDHAPDEEEAKETSAPEEIDKEPA